MRTRHLATAALILALPGTLLAQRTSRRDRDRDADNWLENCRRDGDRDRQNRGRFCEERTMGWRGGATLAVDASPNGGVSVMGWDRDSVHVTVRVAARADSDADARDLARRITVERRNGELSADGPPSRRDESWWVSYVIYAPRRQDLRLNSVNGPVDVSDVTGRLELDVVNGPLDLDNVAGDVRARAQNGPLHVRLSGSRWDGAGLDAATVNGPLVLDVPEGYNAELETGTINGPFQVDFPITVQGRIGVGSRRHLTTTLGSGGSRIRAVTSNGPAVIRRVRG